MTSATQSPGTPKNKRLRFGRKLLLGTALVTSLVAPSVAGMAPAGAETASRTIRSLDVYPLEDDCSMTVIGYGGGQVDIIISCPESDDGANWF